MRTRYYKVTPLEKRTPESERGPFFGLETTFRTIHHGFLKNTFSVINIGEPAKKGIKQWSILIHQGHDELFCKWFLGQKMVLFQILGSVLQEELLFEYRVRT